ncbi:unnamed protein product [Ilex paraguariensis]|uniref:Uncharacterized protein n=1 Tax=Ilex paraguariensis TaxID=185542 RepID=A0ABC8TG80_9AQUA
MSIAQDDFRQPKEVVTSMVFTMVLITPKKIASIGAASPLLHDRSVLLSTASIDAALHCYTIGAVLHCYTPKLRVFRYFYTIVATGQRYRWVWRAGLDCEG